MNTIWTVKGLPNCQSLIKDEQFDFVCQHLSIKSVCVYLYSNTFIANLIKSLNLLDCSNIMCVCVCPLLISTYLSKSFARSTAAFIAFLNNCFLGNHRLQFIFHTFEFLRISPKHTNTNTNIII